MSGVFIQRMADRALVFSSSLRGSRHNIVHQQAWLFHTMLDTSYPLCPTVPSAGWTMHMLTPSLPRCCGACIDPCLLRPHMLWTWKLEPKSSQSVCATQHFLARSHAPALPCYPYMGDSTC